MMRLFRQWPLPFPITMSRALKLVAATSIGMSASILGGIEPATAAEEVIFTYGALNTTFTIDELDEFAETGVVPRKWRFYFNVSDTDPEVLQTIFSQEFKVSLEFADEALNTIPGEFALFSLGQVVHTRSRLANIQALRSAFVLSLVEDGEISLLEFIRNYPLQQMYIDGIELTKFVNEVSRAVEEVEAIALRLEAYWAITKELLEEFICECETGITTPIDTPSDVPTLESWLEPAESPIARPEETSIVNE